MVNTLQKHKHEWAALPIKEKIGYLQQLQKNIDENAAHWAGEAVKAKGIVENTAGVGEEWMSGPWAVLSYLTNLMKTLAALEKGQKRELPSVRPRADGQVVATVFPLTIFDRLLLNGVTAEVWMQSGVTRENLTDTMAVFYKQKSPHGKVTLILGAGNISSIPPLDVLYKMFAEGQVCILKMNPVNEYLGPIFEKIFEPFIQAGFLHIVYGGAEVGAYLTSHEGIEEIHVTGSHLTHDAIVYGPGGEGQKRKETKKPLLTKPITSELGGCSPTIVVPGPWTDADIRYHAEHIATQKYHNAGFNCIASQVLVLPEEWQQSAKLLDAVSKIFAEIPRRKAYYPRAKVRQQSVVAAHPNAQILDAPEKDVPRTLVTGLDAYAKDEVCFKEEFFGGVLAQTGLPGSDASEFLENAIKFCNEKLSGTLGANIIIHPKTIKELGSRFEGFIAELNYGGIGVNAWTGVNYLLSSCTWGAFPGHTPEDIQSGIGVVHNAFLFDKPQKSVVYANFHPFPRALVHGHFHLSPKPPWFVTHKRAHTVGRRLARFEVNPGFRHIPGIFVDALRG